MATNRTIKVKLEAEVANYMKNMDNAAKATERMGTTAEGAGKRGAAFWQDNRANIDRTASSLMLIGGAGVAALGLMTKQAMSWESAWAGVTKTVDGTTEEMASLEKGLRQLATELPSTHEEIAAVAEAAGQLGIQTPNVISFTKTMIDLGQATNLSAEEAATGLARFSNIMGTNQKDIGRLGSTLVGLGNNFATTEAEILEMSMRLAGAGKQAGLTESDVMGLATAMSSVGIDAEAGGTAMSLTMKRISKEVETSGESLDLLASIAGVTSEQFSKAWGEDAAGALTMFVGGLSDTERLGMSTNAVLEELGIKGIREADALLRLSGAQGIMNEALGLGADAYRENTALIDEANKRYETTESKVRMAGNAIKDASIDIGAYVLPVLADLARGVADVAGWFGDLPEPVKKAVAQIGGIGSVSLLALGGVMKLTGSLLDSVTAVKAIAQNMPRAASAIATLGKSAGIAGLALAAMYGLEQVTRSKIIVASVEEITASILDLAGGAEVGLGALEDLFQVDGDNWKAHLGLDGIADGFKKITGTDLGFFEKVEKHLAFLPGIDDKGIRQAAENFEKIDTAMAQLVTSGNADKTLETWAMLQAEADSVGVSVEDLVTLFPEYAAALKATENDARLAAEATGEVADATEELSPAALAAQREVDALGQAFDEQAEAAGAAWEALNAWVGGAVSLERAGISYESAIDGVTEALEKNGKTLDITTEKGRANRGSLLDIVDAGMSLIEAERSMGASEEELQGIMQRTRDDLIKGAKQMGMNGDQAVAYADDLGLIPENVDTEVLLGIDRAQANKEQLKKEISIAGMSLSDWEIDADGKYAIAEADGVKYKIDRTTGEIKIEGKDKNALAKAREIVNTINDRTASVPMSAHGTNSGYENAALFRTAISKPVTVPIIAQIRNNAALKAAATIRGIFGNATGGRAGVGSGLPEFASGGRLPRTGLGTDQILGVNPMGQPTAWVDDREWIINRKSSDKYDGLLNAINQDSPSLQGLAGGGVARGVPVGVSAGTNGGFDYSRLARELVKAQGPASGPQVNINQVNHNPQAVPTVVQNQRALVDVAALGVFGNV